MNTRYCGLRARTWLAGVGLFAVLTTLVVAADVVSHHATKDNAVSSAAWYVESAPPLSGNAIAGRPNAVQMTAGDPTRYAKEMSKAFHDAASRVLPCMVMITNSPAMAENHGHQKSTPDQNSEEIPFGLKGTPFGNLFNNPELRHFFKEFHGLPCRTCRDKGWWALAPG